MAPLTPPLPPKVFGLLLLDSRGGGGRCNEAGVDVGLLYMPPLEVNGVVVVVDEEGTGAPAPFTLLLLLLDRPPEPVEPNTPADRLVL